MQRLALFYVPLQIRSSILKEMYLILKANDTFSYNMMEVKWGTTDFVEEQRLNEVRQVQYTRSLAWPI